MNTLDTATPLPEEGRPLAWFYRGTRAAWLVLIMTLAGTSLAWYYTRELARQHSAAGLENAAADLRNRIERRMTTYEQVLHAGSAYFKRAEGVNRREWHDFVDDLKLAEHFPGIGGIGFARAVQPIEKDMFVRETRDDGLPEYAIFPPGERAFYAPIVSLEPHKESYGPILGFDLYTDPLRRPAMERARDTGSATLTGKVRMMQALNNEESAFLMLVPVYRYGMPRLTEQQRRESLYGWVVAPVEMNAFMTALLGTYSVPIAVEIVDINESGESRRIFGASAAGAGGAADRTWTQEQKLRVADRHWLIRFSPEPSFDAPFYTSSNWILFCGVLTSLLLFAVAKGLSTTRVRALALADRLTRELRQSNEQLSLYAKERTAELQAILSVSPIPIAHLIGRRFNWVNPALETLIGYQASELVGQCTRILFPSDAAFDAFSDKFMHMIEAGQLVVSEQVLVTRDGRRLICEGHIKILDPADISRGAVLLFQDVTERRRSEEALRESERYNRLLFEASPVGLMLCRMDGVMVDVNQAYANIVGRAIDEIIGLEYSAITPEKYETQDKRQLDSLREAGHYGPFYKEYMRRDGQLVPVRLFGRLIERSGVQFIWSAVEDITEEKENERRIQEYIGHIEEQNLTLAQNDRLKTEFLNNMSHELKTPLNAIIGFSELMVEGVPEPLPARQQEYAQDVLDAGRHLHTLIDEILTYTRSEAGQVELRLDAVSVEPFLESRINAFRQAAAAKGIALMMSVAPGCGSYVMDRERLGAAIDQILSNAVKFTARGGRVALTAAWIDGEPAQQSGYSARLLEIAIADTGIGIPAKSIEFLFQPFVQADGKLTRPVGGTGLGLALARRLVRLHGGTIEVESEPGAGSIFRLHLPPRQDVNADPVEIAS